jgi:hypothetical protein
MPHPWASLPMMGVLPNLIYAREALFAYVNSPERDMRNLRAIRPTTPKHRARDLRASVDVTEERNVAGGITGLAESTLIFLR